MLFKKFFALSLAVLVGILLPVMAIGANQFKSFNFTDRRGNAIPAGTVYVFTAGTSSPATIYDESGNTLAQPLETNTFGQVSFAAANGTYDLQLSGSGIAGRTMENVQFFDYLTAVTTMDRFIITTYGAIANDGIDDTVAIQATVDAAEANGGGVVYAPPGTFNVENPPIYINAADASGGTVMLVGDGLETTTFNLNSASGNDLIAVDGIYSSNPKPVVIRDLTLSCGGHSGDNGIALRNCEGATISNVFITGFGSGAGILIDADGSGSNKSRWNTVSGVTLTGCARGIILDCSGTGASQYNRDNYIEGVRISGSTSDDFLIRNDGHATNNGCTGHIITNCIIECSSGAGHGFEIEDDVSGVQVYGLAIRGDATEEVLRFPGTLDFSLFSGLSIEGKISQNVGPGTVAIRNTNIYTDGPWERALSIRDFGAIPDNDAVDNTACIQAAADSAASRFEYGAIVIPPGKWRITDPLYIKSNVSVFGYGQGSVIYVDSDKRGLYFEEHAVGVSVANLKILGNAAIGGGTVVGRGGIGGDNITDVMLSNIWIEDVNTGGFGFHNVNQLNASNIHVTNTWEHGFYIDVSEDVLLSNIYIRNAGKLGPGQGSGMKIKGSKRVTITGCKIYNSEEHGLLIEDNTYEPAGCEDLHITGIVAEGNVDGPADFYGLYIKGNVDNVHITGSKFVGQFGCRVRATGSTWPSNVMISGCHFVSDGTFANQPAFYHEGGEHFVLTGNYYVAESNTFGISTVGSNTSFFYVNGGVVDAGYGMDINSASTNVRVDNVILKSGTHKTINTGAIRAENAYMMIDTEGGGASDYLDKIEGGRVGQLLTLSTTDDGRDVTIRDALGTGENIQTPGDGSLLLSTSYDTVVFVFNGTYWLTVSTALTN